MPSSVRILKNRNYRLYFLGQLVSHSGTWMQSVAQSWLVYRLTDSGYWLGLVTFFLHVPAFLAAPFAGALTDQVDRRKMLLATELVAVLQALVLAALVFTNLVQVWHVLALSVVLGIINAFEMTSRMALVVDIVGKADLSSAITFNVVVFNISRVAGPALAGFLLATLGESGHGEGWCFVLNAVSYLAVAYGLLNMKVRNGALAHAPGNGPRPGMFSNIADGWHYTRRNPVIFRLMILSTLICFITWPFMILLPVFAKTVLGGGPHTLAWLTATLGAGAVFGAFLFIRDDEVQVLKRRLVQNIVLCALCMMAFAASKTFSYSLLCIFGVGAFLMTLFPTMTNAIQHMVEDSKRGRVASLYNMTFLGTTPIGGVIVGALADRYSAPQVVTWTGTLTLAMGMALVLRQLARDSLLKTKAR